MIRQTLLFVMILLSGSTFAQSTNSFYEKMQKQMYINVATDVSTQSKGYNTLGVDIQMGWKLTPNLLAYAVCNGGRTLYEKDEIKDHMQHCNIGGGLGYRQKLSGDNESIDFKASVSTSVGKNSWKNTAYDAGVFYRFASRGVSPQLGLGYRYYDSRTSGVKDHGCIYASIGFSL